MLATIKPSAPAGEELNALHISGDLVAASCPILTAGDVVVDGRVCAGAEIRADGNVRIGGNVQSAKIFCGGELTVALGGIIGGSVAAYQGITCQFVGHRVKAATELSIGFDEQFLDAAEKRVAEIEAALKKAGAVRLQLERLRHMNLTPTQKEHATELLFGASAAEKRAATAVEELKARFSAMGAGAEPACIVAEALFAGVTICFPGIRALVTAPIKGPVKICPAAGSKGLVIQAQGINTGKSQVLDSVPHTGRRENLLTLINQLDQTLCR
jgi:uncharacterized protein (DUF342 family)